MMDNSPNPADSEIHADSPVFSARLSPHRSLSRTGLMLLIGFVAIVSLFVSIPFYLLGAWPVLGFFGVDVLLLYIAFRVSNARARVYEELVLTRIELLFRKVCQRGTQTEHRFNPLWVRLDRIEHAEFGTQRLALVEGRRRVELGGFLGAEEKADFAGALSEALVEARRR